MVSSARMKSIWGGGRGAEPAPGATLIPSSSVWCVRRVCWMLVLTCVLPGCAALTFELPSNGGQKCFYEDARKDTVMEATFRVIGNTYDKKLPPVDAEVKCWRVVSVVTHRLILWFSGQITCWQVGAESRIKNRRAVELCSFLRWNSQFLLQAAPTRQPGDTQSCNTVW